jgi:hypothetical protein
MRSALGSGLDIDADANAFVDCEAAGAGQSVLASGSNTDAVMLDAATKDTYAVVDCEAAGAAWEDAGISSVLGSHSDKDIDSNVVTAAAESLINFVAEAPLTATSPSTASAVACVSPRASFQELLDAKRALSSESGSSVATFRTTSATEPLPRIASSMAASRERNSVKLNTGSGAISFNLASGVILLLALHLSAHRGPATLPQIYFSFRILLQTERHR